MDDVAYVAYRCTGTWATVAVVARSCSQSSCQGPPGSREPGWCQSGRPHHVVDHCHRARQTLTVSAAPRPSTTSCRSPRSASVSSRATSVRRATGMASFATCHWRPAEDTAFYSPIPLPCRSAPSVCLSFRELSINRNHKLMADRKLSSGFACLEFKGTQCSMHRRVPIPDILLNSSLGLSTVFDSFLLPKTVVLRYSVLG